MEDLEEGVLEYETVGEFLDNLKKEFGEGDEKSVKVVELKRMKQGGKTIEKFVQKFRRVARGSGYKGRSLVEEFKREINVMIHQKLMKAE